MQIYIVTYSQLYFIWIYKFIDTMNSGLTAFWKACKTQNQIPFQKRKIQVKETAFYNKIVIFSYILYLLPFIYLYHYIRKTILQKEMNIITEELIQVLCLIIQYKLFSCNPLQETVTLYPLI